MDTNSSHSPLSPDRAVSTRRTFLKGTTIALPAIITLRSGAALAMTSSARCLEPLKTAQPPVLCNTGSPDNFMRAQCQVFNKRIKTSSGWTTTSTPVYFKAVKEDGSDCVRKIADYTIVTESYSTGAEWLKCNFPTGCGFSNGKQYISAPAVSPTHQLALINFSLGGTVISVGAKPGSAGTVCVTHSCVHSVWNL